MHITPKRESNRKNIFIQAREDFLKTWPKVKEYLCKVDEGESMDETVDWLSKSLDYNVKDGKMIR